MSKTLSNGVLSLRFMQNAQRAKQLKEVELHRAEVVDEGKWQVSLAIREAWGLTKERTEDQDTNVHEASYLPFLYPNPDEGSPEDCSSISTGRRVFKHTSLDVPDDNSEDTQGKDVPAGSASGSSSKPSNGRIHAHPRPISLSGLHKGKVTLLKGFDQMNGSGYNSLDMKSNDRKLKGKEMRIPKSTARELIFEKNGNAYQPNLIPVNETPAFVKPAGVDDPKEAVSSAAKIASKVGAQTVDGARQKSKKIKRERDGDDEEEEVKKKSKKKPKKKISESHG